MTNACTLWNAVVGGAAAPAPALAGAPGQAREPQIVIQNPVRETDTAIANRVLFARFNGKYGIATRSLLEAVFALGNATVIKIHLRRFVEGQCYGFTELSDAQITEICTGTFFTRAGILPVNISKLKRGMNTRLCVGPPMSVSEALTEAIAMLGRFVNLELAQHLTDFMPVAKAALERECPEFLMDLSAVDFMLYFLEFKVFPLMSGPSTVDNPVAAMVYAAQTAILEPMVLLTTVLRIKQWSKHNGAPNSPRASGDLFVLSSANGGNPITWPVSCN